MMAIIVIIIQELNVAKRYIVGLHLLNIVLEYLILQMVNVAYQNQIIVDANINPVKI
jgi:hypothetical protein